MSDVFCEQFKRVVDQAIDASPKINRMGKDIDILKLDVSVLKEDSREAKKAIFSLQGGVHKLGLLYENMNSKIDQILEIALDTRERQDKFEALSR